MRTVRVAQEKLSPWRSIRMSLVDEEVVLCPFSLLVTVCFLPRGIPSYLFSIREKKVFSTKLNSFLLSDRKYPLSHFNIVLQLIHMVLGNYIDISFSFIKNIPVANLYLFTGIKPKPIMYRKYCKRELPACLL